MLRSKQYNLAVTSDHPIERPNKLRLRKSTASKRDITGRQNAAPCGAKI